MVKPISPVIFREYDIRGVYGETLHAADARRIGAAFGAWLKTQHPDQPNPLVHVGFDGRLSTPVLLENLLAGLASVTGLRVALTELGPTPLLYFSVFTDTQAAGGIMITGSHNPKHHNGFKLLSGRQSLFGPQIQELGRLAAKIDPASIPDAPSNFARSHAVLQNYAQRLAEALPKLRRPLRTVWDAGNGAAGAVLPELIRRLPGEHLVLNEKVDGNFPVHHPDPSVAENLQQLQQAVVDGKYDLGFAFDGDADRLGVVDNRGRIFWGDQILLFLAEAIAPLHPGEAIIADVKCSQVLFDGIAQAGGKPVVWKTGHSLIKAKMRELKAPLAGEMSGHIFIQDQYYGFDDGIYAAIRFLAHLDSLNESLSAWFDRLPHLHSTPEFRIECPDERKFDVIESIRKNLSLAGVEFSAIDGVRANTPDGWWLLRASNTQPALSLRAEASSAQGLDNLQTQIRQQLSAVGLVWRVVGH